MRCLTSAITTSLHVNVKSTPSGFMGYPPAGVIIDVPGRECVLFDSVVEIFFFLLSTFNRLNRQSGS